MGNRHDMVEGEIGGGELMAAVLAAVLVARVDVRATERHVVDPPLDPDVPEEADDRRQPKRDRDRSHLPVVGRDDLDFPLAEQRDGLLPVDDLERLVGRVQEERLLHATVYRGPCQIVSSRSGAKTA
jgi:hypothetical protein